MAVLPERYDTVLTMNDDKRDFNKEAAAWDMQPARLKLADDVAAAITGEMRLSPQMDVLDFGCGTGLLTLRLQPLVRSVTGIDSAPGMLEVLNAKISDQHIPNVTTRCLDLEKGDLLEGRYHLIVSSMTFHHVKDIGRLLGAFHKALMPGGTISIADLDPDDGQFHGNDDGVFHHGFERAELRRVFGEHGFSNIRERTAATVTKPARDGILRQFTVFLLSGHKQESAL